MYSPFNYYKYYNILDAVRTENRTECKTIDHYCLLFNREIVRVLKIITSFVREVNLCDDAMILSYV